ncbi:MAG: hypothetical protein LQ340_006831 [Diploschistes diacapsis]|nr:MAG: hypothetical protein LQ340_006831 [Diploschistes diacapsis]
MPTFIVFKSATPVETIRGADPNKLKPIIRKIAQEADMSDDGAEGGSGGFGDVSPSQTWLGASLPRGYKDVTEQVDVKGLDLLNADSELGGARDLFEAKRPAGLNKGKQGDDSGGKGGAKKDWVESDTDQQLMLFVPFHSSLKIHSLHVTSLAEADGDEVMRPKTIRLFTNRAHTLGFDEAESVEPTQSVELRPGDWDANTGTARVELRFVKFQNVSSLVVFVADGQGTGERTRIDRFRIVGEAGDKREMGKLEKIGEGGGE